MNTVNGCPVKIHLVFTMTIVLKLSTIRLEGATARFKLIEPRKFVNMCASFGLMESIVGRKVEVSKNISIKYVQLGDHLR